MNKIIVPLIYNQNGEYLEGAIVFTQTDEFNGAFCVNGNVLLVPDSLRNTQFSVVADGYNGYSESIDLGTGDKQIRIGLAPDPNRPQDIILPGLTNCEVVESSSLDFVVDGNDFINPFGQRIVRKGVDQFMTYRMWLDGVDLTPFIDESHEFGFDTWRVFMQGAKSQNQVMDLSPNEPGYYERIPEFCDYLNNFNIVPLLTCFIDNQILHSPIDHFTKIVNASTESIRLISGGNEFPKNGFDPQSLPLVNAIWSRGSNLSDQLTNQNGATAAEFHQRRDLPASIMDSVASEVFMHQHGFTMLWMDEPLGFDEVNDPNRRSNDPDIAYKLGRNYATFWALAVFHNSFGQRGLLMGPRTRECALAWQLGMKLN